MRIICDHCNHPVFGTVKKVDGKLNLHPQCLTQFKEAPLQSKAASWLSQEFSVRTLIEGGTNPALHQTN